MAGQEPTEYREAAPAKKSKKLSLNDVKAFVVAEKENAMAAIAAAKLMEERADAMDYFLGRMNTHLPVVDGRSEAVSTDVADAIEGILPSLMDIFAGSDEIMRFDPESEKDAEAAQQETDYLNHVFMQQNNGFMLLYAFFKDALLSKTGIVKVFWEEYEREERETYYDLTEDEFAVLMQAVEESDGMMEVAAHTERPMNEQAENGPGSEGTS